MTMMMVMTTVRVMMVVMSDDGNEDVHDHGEIIGVAQICATVTARRHDDYDEL